MYWNLVKPYIENGVERLTLTWDVLKSVHNLNAFNYKRRLTLTWDVLKSAPDIAGLPATWD